MSDLLKKLRDLKLYEALEEGWHILNHEGPELFIPGDSSPPQPQRLPLQPQRPPWSWQPLPPPPVTFLGIHLPNPRDRAGFKPASGLEALRYTGTDRLFRSVSLVFARTIPKELEPLVNTSARFGLNIKDWAALTASDPVLTAVSTPREQTVLVRVNAYLVVADPAAAKAWPSPYFPGITVP